MQRRTSLRAIALSLGALLAFGSISVGTPAIAAAAATSSVFSIVMNDTRFTTTMQMLYMTGYANVGNRTNVLTIFAPTEAAWDASDYRGLLSSLASTSATTEFPDPTKIVMILRGVAVAGFVQPLDPGANKVSLTSLAGHAIEFDRESKTVTWIIHDGHSKTAHITGAPMLAVNGIVYLVDAVIGQ